MLCRSLCVITKYNSSRPTALLKTLSQLYLMTFSKSSWWIHLLWCALLASSMCLCGYLSHMIWRKFVDNPTFTVVESTHYPVDRISFPAVSICDPESIYGPNTGNTTRILKLRGYNDEDIASFYSSFTKVRSVEYVPDDSVKKMHITLRDLGYGYEDLLNMLKKPCEVLIQECLWRSRPKNCSSMFRSVFTIVGYCCQFDIEYLRETSANNTIFRTGVEISESLEVIINTNRVLANGNSNESYVSLYVFDKQDNLTLLDSAITLTADKFFDVTVDVWVIDSSDDVKSLSLSNRKCFLPSDTQTIANTYQGCMTTLILRKVVEYCRCVPFQYTSHDLGTHDYPNCTWERFSCIHQMLGQVQNNIRDIITENECFQKCDYVQYETEADYIDVRRDGTKKDHNCRVAIHFTDNTCIKYRREVLYTWDQMLANLGGIFGLCLGGSIISVIEILWFILELFCTSCGQKRVANKRSPFTVKTNYNMSPRKKENQLYPFVN